MSFTSTKHGAIHGDNRLKKKLYTDVQQGEKKRQATFTWRPLTKTLQCTHINTHPRQKKKVQRHSLVTDLVPSEMACLASSPGKMSRTAVWISREEMVDFLEYAASSGKDVELKSPFLRITIRKHTRCLCGNPLKDIIDKRVEDGHRLVGDTRIGVYLLEN